MQSIYLTLIQQHNPLVHCITNSVVRNFSANGLLAIGASPLMSIIEQEVADIQQFSQALLINIGTLTQAEAHIAIQAAQAANEQNVPVVLDPVGVGATSYRQEIVALILAQAKVSAIRGNAAEMAFLADVNWHGKGVDVGSGEANLAAIALKVAQKYQCCSLISGATDYVSDGKQVATIENGSPLFPKVTGSGCLQGAILAAFLGVQKYHGSPNPYQACIEASCAYAIAGEYAAIGLNTTQVGTFAVKLLDELAQLTPAKISQSAQVKEDLYAN